MWRSPVPQPKYTLIPGVGQTIGLVEINDLPESIPPPDLTKRIDTQGPIWDQFLRCWRQVNAYYGHGNPGAHWKRRCDLFSQFYDFAQISGFDVWSGIFLFLQDYQKLIQTPDITEWTDEKIKNELWRCVVGSRAHLITGWRVWDNYKA